MIFGLYGPGGFGREVMSMLQRRRWTSVPAARFEDLVFVETAPSTSQVDGVRVVAEAEFIASTRYTHFAIAIADALIRRTISDRLEAHGKIPTTLVSELASISPRATIAPGGIFCDFSAVTANANIGRHFHSNIYSYVAHDCRIGDYVTFAPSVCCNGNIHIGNNAYVGAAAVLKQGTSEAPLTIGQSATIGMAAVVTKSVPEHTVVVGNPARIHRPKQKPASMHDPGIAR